MKWWKDAFAIDPPGLSEPTDAQREVVDRICREIVGRGLSTPALIFLESFRPLNYIGSQVMHFFQPIVTAVLQGDGYRHFTEFLERRGSVDYFYRRIEELEAGQSRPPKR
ncbi:MAG: hypothetical protein A2Z06_01630 [Candidatus Glassbacteria bacterium RBG_16_58_8]|uniref:Uncharacterized protein n=1 Tax=Candidatus Glassbacteria bacterium RBG_16_58_8 TaxID=1817866 RepID=A0A1F5YBL8_9BACT|nr:MAG: hypothetical protein A2Z06_01630 [Candidatus Glassbacteria bacterium RBG_16_58_8]